MPKKPSTILVPIDFSPHSVEALRYAVMLAEVFSASLWVLHVILKDDLGRVAYPIELPGETLTSAPGEGSELVTQAQTALQQHLAAELNGLEAEGRVVVGWPVEDILHMARHDKMDLIVMGTHGRRGLEYHALGSIAEQVGRMASCPVVMVKAT